jgi:amidase
VHPECIKAVEHACKLLESLGHDVEETTPNFQEEEVALNWCILLIGNTAVQVDKLVQVYGSSEVKRKIELLNYAMYSIGKQMKTLDFVKARRKWREFGLIMDQLFSKYDMLLTPTLGEPPILVGSLKPKKSDLFSMRLISSWAGNIILKNRHRTVSIMEEVVQNMMKEQMPFTFIANITGQPAMSVPLHWTETGLPCGVQFITCLGEEAKLIRLAAQLERAQPWIGRKPHILSKYLSQI